MKTRNKIVSEIERIELEMFNKGDKLNYFGKTVEVVNSNDKYVLIVFNTGTKICTPKILFTGKL